MRLLDTLWAVGLAGLGRGGELPVKGLESPELGLSSGKALPKRSRFGISHQPNGGVLIVNPLDIDDDKREARR